MKKTIELVACVANKRVLDNLTTEHIDAFYLGQPYCLKFKGNFLTNIDDLSTAIADLHKLGKKAYLTTPAIPRGKEMPLVKKAIEVAQAAGVDAVEANDVGVFRLIKKDFPKLRVHLGNFANVYNERSAALYKKLGADRVVPNHELTGEELAIVAAVKGLEFERPVHGRLSLGMAFSCLLTQDDPCRQQCVDECYLKLDGWRMRSVGTSLLMGEEYCLIEHLKQVAGIGLSAWRLETYFDDGVKISLLGKIYRRALEQALKGVNPGTESVEAVKELVSTGLCNGWYFGKSGREYVKASDACV